MKERPKDVNENKDNHENSKQIKDKKKESCRFLFDMIGRVFSK